MVESFNINTGLVNVLRGLLHDEGFAKSVIDMLLGRNGASEAITQALRQESYGKTLNEVVAVHRVLKCALNEEMEPYNGKDKKILRKLLVISRKSMRFQSEVIAKTLKKPGAVKALIKLIGSKGRDKSAWMVLAPMVIESANETASEDEQMQVALSESIADSGNKVNIMVGRFQPFTLGHLKCLIAIKEKLGIPTFLCVIPGNGDDKHPFMGAIQDEMLERLAEAYPDVIAGFKYVKNAFLETWVIAANEADAEPVSLTCGTDRYDAYNNMVQKYGQKYGLNPDFKVFCLDRADDNISATSVRECLLNDDKEGFIRQMPECLHPMYDKLRNTMVADTVKSFANK